jgi:hypothetical protein
MGNWFGFSQTSRILEGSLEAYNLKNEEINLRDIEIGPRREWSAPETGIENRATD